MTSHFAENLIERIKELIDQNDDITRTEFLAATGKIFSELKGKPERKKKEAKVSKTTGEVKAKRAPSKYNIYMKEQMPKLSAREKLKDGDKKTTRELMQEIGEMWALEKERVKSESDQASSEHEEVEAAEVTEEIEETKPKIEKASKKDKTSKKPEHEIEEEKEEIEEEKEEIEEEKKEEPKPRHSNGGKAPRKALNSRK